MSLEKLLAQITPLDNRAMQSARARQDQLTKPQGSLGRLEYLSIQIAGITAQPQPAIRQKVIIVMAGDHGVVDEGVSAFPQDVTPQMVQNFLHGGAAINVLARHVGARVVIADLGVAVDLEPHPDLVVRKIDFGTQNIARGPAMSPKQAEKALLAGAKIVEAQIGLGMDALATGDMCIGNTTPSAAIAAALTGHPARKIVGRGTGVDDRGLERKIGVVQKALEVNQPDGNDALDVLAKVGGFEIGGLAGAILAAAANRKPVVIDGFISTAAAMLAVTLAPLTRDYLIAAHSSMERGHHLMLNWLHLIPLLDLQMRLGEGTGAALALSLLEASCKILSEMATFGTAGVSGKIET
ncbi:MAG: nicotinate-nucleotide--dimethylbenzimidazole phosphoribosyltransferase [Anaerolineales bacterium]